ncbi:uncharacterized protein TNCT_172531 [Trichonephila clavata]|uniref:Uncharacterized protein n=1 Tax=Trichonephila clavata TaxID=2740835 RepID=A0A8X6EY35_TRICU|nr:uncharacterized protein TNCT_172531 [Trichonephila clavata]
MSSKSARRSTDYRRKKRRFCGNQHSKNETLEPVGIDVSSASSKKLCLDSCSYQSNSSESKGYWLINLDILLEELSKYLICFYCGTKAALKENVLFGLGKDLQLHIFCDSSPRPFGAVAYFRYVTENDDIFTRFIIAKSRVSPFQEVNPHVSNSFNTIHWIKGKPSKYKQFASNRVIEIQSNSDLSDWHHYNGRENPADYVSRGANLEKIIKCQIWMHGPQWLRTTKNNWPKDLNCDTCKYAEQVFNSYEKVNYTQLQ